MSSLGLDTDLMMMRIEDIIIKSILSVESKMFKASEKQVPYRTNSFQFLGFDILIDSNLKPWLLEVNMNSSLACETEMDRLIKSDLISNLFTLIGVEPLSNKSNPEQKRNQNFSKFAAFKSKKDSRVKTSKRQRRQDLAIIQETREEVLRAKRWKLIYPSYNVAMYKCYFEEDREFNSILRNEYSSLANSRIVKNLGKFQTPQDIAEPERSPQEDSDADEDNWEQEAIEEELENETPKTVKESERDKDCQDDDEEDIRYDFDNIKVLNKGKHSNNSGPEKDFFAESSSEEEEND